MKAIREAKGTRTRIVTLRRKVLAGAFEVIEQAGLRVAKIAHNGKARFDGAPAKKTKKTVARRARTGRAAGRRATQERVKAKAS